MIRTSICWNTEKNLIKEYNYDMSTLPDDGDFRCFIDGDASFTTDFWGKQLEQIITTHPECGCFVATTNRIAPVNQHQLPQLIDWNNNDFADHRRIGKHCWKKNGTNVIDFSKPDPCHLSGFLILLKKKTWEKIGGFKAWDDKSNILGIDSRLHQDLYEAGEKVYVMSGIYLYHWYRGGNINDKSHILQL